MNTLNKREAIATATLQGLIIAYGSRKQGYNVLANDWKQGLARSAVLFADELIAALDDEPSVRS